ncbi:MAG TPA: ABC transporter ATP-binding protein [Terriglobales bacterium]|nr:ABC transporter ATP-binding protein [Terriglobales bacterium]
MADAIRIDSLKKSFRLGFIPKTREILKGISLSVREGEIFGYLGPNGAGKTTTIKCLLGLIFPDAGTIEVFGQSHLSARARQSLGFLPENPYFYDYLTAAEFLAFTADLFGLDRPERDERIARLLKLVGLERAASLRLRKFSRGMLQRVGLAQALINDPKLVILDEPLGGMDPLGRKEIRDIILRFKDEGKTVFFTSHILQDIEMICDHVAIVVGGRVVKQGPLQDLVSERVLFTEVTVLGVAPEAFRGLGEGVSARGDRVFLRILEETRVEEVLALVRERRGRVVSLSPRTETLEDIFVETVTGK